MGPRTAAEVGTLVKARREKRGLSQHEVPGISPALVGQIEQGRAPAGGRARPRHAFMAALGWPDDAIERLAHGEDPDSLGETPREPDRSAAEDLAVAVRDLTKVVRELRERLDDGWTPRA